MISDVLLFIHLHTFEVLFTVLLLGYGIAALVLAIVWIRRGHYLVRRPVIEETIEVPDP